MSILFNKRDADRWTDEKIELLKKLWAQGISLTGIAKQLGPGFTKGMVAGRRWRLQLPERPSPFKPASATPALRLAIPAQPPAPLSDRQQAELLLPRRNNQCHHLMELRDTPGGPLRYAYCPAEIRRGSRFPYCEAHLSQAKSTNTG